MKILISILLIISFMTINAQTNIVALPGEYIEAENYGGKVELKRFLQQEMNYPEVALKNKTEGIVELSFVVDRETSKTSLLHIKKSVSKEIDAEAIRLYKMLLFVPSFYKGGKVTTYSSLKIKFSIKNYKRICKKRGYEKIDIYASDVDTSNVIYKDNQLKIKPKMIFKDTLDNISSFIYNNIKYPQGTLNLNLTGVVKLSLVIESSGRITNIKVIRSLGGGATNEAIRLLKLTRWQPGEKNGKKVRVNKIFEVNFNLTNDSGMNYVPTSY
jgi:TonB family protein